MIPTGPLGPGLAFCLLPDTVAEAHELAHSAVVRQLSSHQFRQLQPGPAAPPTRPEGIRHDTAYARLLPATIRNS